MLHRHLRRVLLEGSHADGSKVKHVYDFVDFDVIQPRADDFDPCVVFAANYPEGDASACGCSSKPTTVATSVAKCDSPDSSNSPLAEVGKALAFIASGAVLAIAGHFAVRKLGSVQHRRFEDGRQGTENRIGASDRT